MGIRSNAMLAIDFPVDTTAHLQASNRKLDSLASQGFLGDFNDYLSIQAWLGAAMDALAETFAAPTAVLTGTAGPTNRLYYVVPNYPLEYGPGAASAPAGNFLNFLGCKPPYGFAPSTAANTPEATTDGERSLYGPMSPQTEVGVTLPLSPENYVTVTTPAAKELVGVKFDIVTGDGQGGYFLVAAGVEPGTAINDEGPATAGGSALYMAPYVPRAHAEIAYDPAAGGTTVYGSLHRN